MLYADHKRKSFAKEGGGVKRPFHTFHTQMTTVHVDVWEKTSSVFHFEGRGSDIKVKTI